MWVDHQLPGVERLLTLIERKLRMPQIQGVQGRSRITYCELLVTKDMGYHRLSRRVNKIEKKRAFITHLDLFFL